MAVHQPVIGQNHDVFRSVFPASRPKAPAQPERFEPQAKRLADQVFENLLHDSRTALGIGDAKFTFGASGRRRGNLFYTSLSQCSPMTNIPPPSQGDINLLCNSFVGLSSWNHVYRWRDQLGRNKIQTCFARVTDRLLSEFVEWSYSGIYRHDIHDHLQFWIENVLVTFIQKFLALLTSQNDPQIESVQTSTRLFGIGIQRLATLRVQELFGIVVEWDNTAAGIDDLKLYAANPAARSYVTNNFSETLSTRLLHPGASTIEILQVYITIIRAFRRLDPKGVLLERVARRTRRYLRERDDTIKVVVTGLLSDVDPEHSERRNTSNPDVLTELAYELQQRNSDDSHANDSELDWNNMEWMPDPVDAAPDYMRSMNTDVVGSVISLFESKESVVRELQTALAERLLRNKLEFDQEISVVEHLKIRFGDHALQACEVMLRDVSDSRKLDQVIRQDQGMEIDKSNRADSPDEFEPAALHAKVLSRLFWPSLPEQNFKPPMQILEQRNRYEKGFESIKQTRKLTWNDMVGQVEVELEFDDGRAFGEEVLPYQATIIYAFQNDEDLTEQSATWSLSSLATELEMNPTLLRSGLMFWVSKSVLAELPGQKDTYTVLERLPASAGIDDGSISSHPDGGNMASHQQSAAAMQAQAEVAAAQALKEAEDAERKQKLALYHQFIVSMLTNQGAMPLSRIAMMLGIVVPGGFPFSNEELKEFLNSMVKEGVLEIGKGSAYKISN